MAEVDAAAAPPLKRSVFKIGDEAVSMRVEFFSVLGEK